MKLFKKTLIILGTLVTLIMLFSLFAVNTAALSPEGEEWENTIYYFNDYYPTIDYETLSQNYPTYNIVYDYEYVDSIQSFNYASSSFYSFGDDCVLILDLKKFVPDDNTLTILFSNIKALSDCTIIVISAFDLAEYGGNDFMDWVDLFYYLPSFDRLNSIADGFMEQIFNELYYPESYEEFSLLNKSIILDGRMIDTDLLLNEYNNNADAAIADSDFIAFALAHLALITSYNLIDGNDDDSIIDYTTFLTYLKSEYNINFFIHLEENYFVDLLTRQIIQADDVEEIRESGLGGNYEWDYLYAIGFLPLDEDLYDFIYQEQLSFEEIFLIVRKTVESGEGGLPYFPDYYYSELSAAELSSLSAIQEIF